MIFDGKKFAAEKEEKLKVKVAKLRKEGIIPKLVSILIGENSQSELYLKKKSEAAQRVGIKMEIVKTKADLETEKIVKIIKQLNNDKTVQGIMVQLPLPKKLEIRNSKFEIIGAIAPDKDVDCLTPQNLGLLMMGEPRFLPATVKAVINIIQSSKFKVQGSDVCVVGASEIVGKPLALILSDLGATVTICRSTTKNLAEFTKKADILISATGVPGLIKKEMVKKEAVVIDIGIKKLKIESCKLKIAGDVNRDVAQVASFLTPVPGGVGPVTVVCLLENLVEAITSLKNS